jgi:parvulin-like peptidyl-prolyl isomerase
MPESYRATLQGLAPGDVTDVVESEEGFVVFQLVRIDEPRRPTVDEVKRELRDAVKDQKSAEEFTEWVARLRKEIFVKIL